MLTDEWGVMSDASRHVSLEQLAAAFARELETDKRAAAETAYALAFLYRNSDVEGRRRFDLAKLWASRSVEILDGLPSSHIAHLASGRMTVGGVPIPDILHAGVVRSRLADVLT